MIVDDRRMADESDRLRMLGHQRQEMTPSLVSLCLSPSITQVIKPRTPRAAAMVLEKALERADLRLSALFDRVYSL